MVNTQFIQALSRKYFSKEALRTKKILVIDDDNDILGIIKIVLERQGYLVETDSTSEALHNMSQMPDLIIIDVNLQKEDGRDICNYLKKNDSTKDIPVILYTGHSLEYVNSYPGKFNPDCILAKPFTIGDLKENILKVLLSKRIKSYIPDYSN